jgi:hypothetical protein
VKVLASPGGIDAHRRLALSANERIPARVLDHPLSLTSLGSWCDLTLAHQIGGMIRRVDCSRDPRTNKTTPSHPQVLRLRKIFRRT